jgi:hypothetical protein
MSMRARANSRAASVLAISLLALAGCDACVTGGLKPPPQLSPIGDTAFYARRAIQAVSELQEVAAEGEVAGVISTEDARKIMEATKTAGKAGVDLSSALKAGVSEVGARDRAVAVFRQALLELPGHLSENTRNMVEPYIQAALTLLTVFG